MPTSGVVSFQFFRFLFKKEDDLNWNYSFEIEQFHEQVGEFWGSYGAD